MPRYEDLTGKKFGNLTAIRPTDQRIRGHVVWECKCDCGNTTYVSSSALKSGNTTSCGCVKHQKRRKAIAGQRKPYKINDLTGQKFAMLTVIRLTDKREFGSVVWECRCDCGNTTYVTSGALKSGNVKSCGCLKVRTDLTGQRFGSLIVIKPTDKRYDRRMVWECRCDCGNTTYVRGSSLSSGNTTSCGGSKHRRKGKGSDLTGQKFGKLTAIRPTDQRIRGYVVWECKCDCGNTSHITSRRLKNGCAKSCGCLNIRCMDITGQKFGKLTAVRPIEKRYGSCIAWECRCDCGNITYASSTLLKSGKKISCGCVKPKGNRVDITGQKFGRLTAIRPTDKRKNGYILWECKCDCGNTVYVSATKLIIGNTKSCGCSRPHKYDKALD